ncbi:hypothetical protein TRIATDRAFT_220016 [Trichoderma atroviride IMI 206040]|uniref:Zn(2)-C6 fungal-type domain-containing protein n=1 Tax=Hypocrea atroviridis (strain ATCC 20476 / IMI 206040) TaxID=452589 RepID=G9NTJ7_HYPAI|nr:uncharacterized protein TRIATDRAFT_220016 [Trichoderma atroviride IMI 206040]EHK46038.1 hypothetical protein TRIATDRAFT_220016 [Trichoderma atroviride IMI 206040]
MEPQLSQNSQQPRKRRHQKPRVLLSCNTCRKDKLKCDRRKPCATCVKRHREASCAYGRERPAPANNAGSSTINDRLLVDDRLRSFDGRLRHLEDEISKKNLSWPELRDAELPCPTTRRSGSDTISCRVGSKPLLDSESRCGISQPTSNDTLFTNQNHWLAIMNDATTELVRYNINIEDGLENKQQRSCQGPALLTGFFKDTLFMEHLGKLPPRETADALVYRCLDSTEPFLITIHAPTFKQEYLEFWQNPESFPPAWLSLLYGILCCSIWMDHTTDSNVAGLSLPSDFEFYRIQSAAFLAKSDMAIPGKYKVEAAVVYLGMEYERTDNLKTDVSVLLGLVSRLAIVSGYHRDTQIHNQITIFEAEMRRRAWLTLLVTDCVVAYETGLPRVVPSQLGDAKRPRNLLDEDFDPFTLELPSARIATRACNRIIYMEKMNSILSMAADIADLAPDLASQPKKVASLCEQLNAIRDSIPTVLRIASTGSSITDEKMAIWRSNLEMTYQRTCCVLHRPFLTKRSTDFQTQSFRETCVSAAERILELENEIFQVYSRKTSNRHKVWFQASRCVSDGLTAAMVVCLELVYRREAEESTSPVDSDRLVQLLKSLYESWKSAPRISFEFDAAAKILVVMLRRLGICKQNRGSDEASSSRQMELCSSDVLPQEPCPTHDMEDDEFTSSQNAIYELLSIDTMEDLFDWVSNIPHPEF